MSILAKAASSPSLYTATTAQTQEQEDYYSGVNIAEDVTQVLLLLIFPDIIYRLIVCFVIQWCGFGLLFEALSNTQKGFSFDFYNVC